MEQVKVLSAWPSMLGMRVLIGLEEKGVKYEYQEEVLTNKSELLLQMNPVHKKISVLIHNGQPISDSLIILRYIDEAWGSEQFLPSKPYDRALAHFWVDFTGTKIPFESEYPLLDGRIKRCMERDSVKKALPNPNKVLEFAIQVRKRFLGD